MEYLKARAKMYEMIKTAFCPPDEALVAGMVSGDLESRIQAAVEQCCSLTSRCCLPPDLMAEIQGLSQSVKEERDPRKSLESFEVEYMRLFVSAFPTLWAPPYESYYAEKKVMGKAAMDCLALYSSDGLAMSEGGELPDHIVTQLEYLHFLCLAAMQAVATGDTNLVGVLEEKQRRFYEDHIMNWVPAFCDRIQSHSQVVFYRVVSRLLKNFALMENRSLNAEELDLFEEVGNDEATRA